MYNITELQAATSFVEIVQYANNSVGGILGDLFMISVFFVLFFVLKRGYDFDDTITTSGFIAFVLSLFLYNAHLCNLILVLAFGTLTMFGVLYLYVVKGHY